MIIECLIKRDGLTEFNHAGMKYIFKSRPELTGGDKESNVCEVCADHAVKRLLATKGFYREYQSKKTEAPSKPAETGVSFTKEEFFVLTNYAQITKAIKGCKDKELLFAIGAQEDSSATRRPWLIELLDGRLKELEAT